MTARLYVLAGVNGGGKSSIGGAMIRSAGGEYYNPDEAARRLMQVNPGLDQTAANAAAWQQGRRLLERAIVERLDTLIRGDIDLALSRFTTQAAPQHSAPRPPSDGQAD